MKNLEIGGLTWNRQLSNACNGPIFYLNREREGHDFLSFIYRGGGGSQKGDIIMSFLCIIKILEDIG